MATTSLSSSPSKVTAAKQLGGISRSSSTYTQLSLCSRRPFQTTASAKALHKHHPELLQLSPARSKHARTCPATDNDQAAPAPAAQDKTTSTPPPAPSPGADDEAPVTFGSDAQPSANGLAAPAGEPPRPRAPLTARERLRAARVLGKYAEPGGGRPAAAASKGSAATAKKPEFGSRVLDALREADGGGRRADRKRSGLPEAPSNMFEDSKRGLSKGAWTFEALPFGTDVLVIVASFTLITVLMFGTTYLVWKLGAIHFNEY